MKRVQLCLILLLPLVSGCSRQEYDIWEGMNTEMTLFEEEVSAPLGSIGPITLGSFVDKLGRMEGIGQVLGELLKVADDGLLKLETRGAIFKKNVYEVSAQLNDPGLAQAWDAGPQSAQVDGMVTLLSYFGLVPVRQQLGISATNPLRVEVPVTSSATYRYTGEEEHTARIPEMDRFTLPRRGSVDIVSVSVPESVSGTMSSLDLSHLTFDLPANMLSRIADDTGNLFFSLDYVFSCGLAVGKGFKLPLSNISTGKIGLPMGQFKLKKCQLTLEVESTIPIAVGVDNVRLLRLKENEGDEAVADENIKIVSGFTIGAGSMENPATSNITVSIEALEGCIPDIGELLLDIQLTGAPGFEKVALTTRQGVQIKSSSAVVSGGITIPEK